MYTKTTSSLVMPSEIRQNLITGEFTIIATERAKRPEDFAHEDRTVLEDSKKLCPFDDFEKSQQEADVLIYRDVDNEWTLRVIPNKFPAVRHENPLSVIDEGPYHSTTGTGYHEVVVLRDHTKDLALLEVERIAELFDAYQERYLELMSKKDVRSINIFHNHGFRSGATLSHPHSQILALPVVSPDIKRELEGARRYRKRARDCAYCTILEYETDREERIVYMNSEFVVYCPFASQAAFEMHVVPRRHEPFYERIDDTLKLKLADAVQNALSALFIALDDPDYNLSVRSAPCDGSDYSFFHWYVVVLPRTSVLAGFELSTRIEISTITPEEAAKFLRRQLR